jgi:hypothetical protein
MDNLVAAAKKVNVMRFVIQGFAGSSYLRTGSNLKTEEDRFDPDRRSSFAPLSQHFAILNHQCSAVFRKAELCSDMDGFTVRGLLLRGTDRWRKPCANEYY